MNKQTILIVDDEPANLKLLQKILEPEFQVRVALNGKQALERVLVEPLPSIVLLDIMMPDMDGYEVCKKIKANEKSARIPVLFLTAIGKEENEAKGFEVGAVDYIQKPVSIHVVLARVKTHLALANQQKSCEETVKKRTKDLEENQLAMINMLGEAGHFNDNDTGLHIWRMAAFAKALAQALNWPVDAANMLELSAPMHDTGKIGIPDSILKAPRPLTDDEWVIMKEHTTIGYSILSKSTTPLFNMASDIALCHHEKWNGTGYPSGLKEDTIPESARIVAIADVFDALTTRRPYKEPWGIEEAFQTISEASGSHFDPNITKVFIEIKKQIIEIKNEWDLK